MPPHRNITIANADQNARRCPRLLTARHATATKRSSNMLRRRSCAAIIVTHDVADDPNVASHTATRAKAISSDLVP
jgi:uncharacterized protein (UPF0147 family)